MRKIKISEDAYLDIEEMFAFISQDNKAAARKLRNKIYDGATHITNGKGNRESPKRIKSRQSANGWRKLSRCA